MQKNREAKQVVVWRNDLKVRKGKYAAQVGHAVMGTFIKLDRERREEYAKKYYVFPDKKKEFKFEYDEGSALDCWINENFPKIMLKVNNETELLELYEKVKDAGLNTVLITDSGLTEFHGVPTNTCIGIGPHWADEIDIFTKHLELM